MNIARLKYDSGKETAAEFRSDLPDARPLQIPLPQTELPHGSPPPSLP